MTEPEINATSPVNGVLIRANSHVTPCRRLGGNLQLLLPAQVLP
jgi:hypothetical protein